MKPKLFTSNIMKKVIKTAYSTRAESDYTFYKMSAVIFTNKKIIVSASNINRTCPRQRYYNMFRPFDTSAMKSCCHAEMHALIKLNKLKTDIPYKDLSIFIFRTSANGNYALAKPCPACEKALKDAGIRHIYYTGNNSLTYEYYLPENKK